MSDKKSKSKSKQKSKDKGDKPPKDVKSKKSKEQKSQKGDTKSKKSAQKTQKVAKKKKDDKSVKVPANQQLDLSQDNFSDFLKNPYSFPPPISSDDALCVHHKQPLTIFCQITQQTGCQQCLVYGPLNTKMNRIIRIDQAFQARYIYLNDMVCGPLLQKRDKLNKYLQQITNLSDQLRYVKGGIQKITKIQFSQMIQRLKNSAGSKFAILHHQMAQLQRDLESINALGNQFFQLTNLNPISPNQTQPQPKAIVPFLLRSRYLQEQAQNLIAKPIKTNVEIYPYDLPRQLTQRKLILQKNKGWVQLLKIKDEAIWTFNQQKKINRQKIYDIAHQQARNQIHQWGKLKQKIEAQLDVHQLYCQKCGALCSQDSVNQECSKGGFHNFIQRK